MKQPHEHQLQVSQVPEPGKQGGAHEHDDHDHGHPHDHGLADVERLPVDPPSPVDPPDPDPDDDAAG